MALKFSAYVHIGPTLIKLWAPALFTTSDV